MKHVKFLQNIDEKSILIEFFTNPKLIIKTHARQHMAKFPSKHTNTQKSQFLKDTLNLLVNR